MGITITEFATGYTNVGAYIPSETRGWDGDDVDEGDEYINPVLTLSDGSNGELRISGPFDDLKELLMLALGKVRDAEQRALCIETGFHINQKVKVGNGNTYWKVIGFTKGGDGYITAHLRQAGSYNTASYPASRLTRVT